MMEDLDEETRPPPVIRVKIEIREERTTTSTEHSPPPKTWGDDEPYQPPPPNPKRQDRNKARAKEWRKNKPVKTPRPAPTSAQAEVASREGPPSDAPLYDTTPFSAGGPFNQEYSQNFDFSCFPTLCEETYTQKRSPKLTRDIPYPVGFFIL